MSLTEAQLECDHKFRDITSRRLKAVEKRGLPSWVERIIEKEDPKWKDKKHMYRESSYLKCSRCGVLRIIGKGAS